MIVNYFFVTLYADSSFFQRNREKIKIMKRLFNFLIILIAYLAFPQISISAIDTAILDGQINAIKKPKAQMDSLYKWSREEVNSEKELYLLEALLALSKENANTHMQIYALRNIMRCQYNIGYPIDSLLASFERLKNINTETKEHKHAMADARSFLGYQYIYEGDFMRVLDIANEMRNEKVTDDYYGTMKSFEILSLAYSEMFQDSIALAYAKEAYKISQTFCDDYSQTISICLSVCGFLNNLDQNEQLKPYITDLEKMIQKEEGRKSDREIDGFYSMLHAYSIGYYLAVNHLDSAQYHVRKAKQYDEVYDHINYQIKNMMIARYYMKINQPDKAWIYVQEIDSIAPLLYLQEQAKVLHAKGQDAEAYEWEDYISQRIQWAFEYTLSKQLTETAAKEQYYATLHDLQEEQEARSDQRRWMLILGVLAAIIVIILLYIMYYRQKMYSKKIEKANNTQRIFLQNMSHELRTPLNAICGFSQLLTDINSRVLLSDEEIKQYGDIVKGNTEMLSTLVNDILDASDLESGKYHIFLADCYPNEICNKAIQTVSYRCPDGVKLYYTSEVDDQFIINSDAQRVQQIIINYLTNAMKHTNKGEIHLHCSLSENPGKLTFSVTDTGVGIPQNSAEMIFERFGKLNIFKQGTGLGLAICRQLATLLNGSVKLDTSYTKGARFIFIHPLKSEESQKV